MDQQVECLRPVTPLLWLIHRKEVLSDEEGRERMAFHCRSVAVAEYNLERSAGTYLQLLHKVVSGMR